MDLLTFGLAALAFVVQLLVLGIGGTYKISQESQLIRDIIAKHREDMDDEFSTLRKEFSDQLNGERRDLGETIAAIRTKVNEVELYVRDTYVERSIFSQVIQSLTNDIKSMGDRIETRMLRLESKIDQALEQTRHQ